mgnify:FL=1
MVELQRRTLEGVGRVYFSEDHDMFLPSVTTVLDQRPTPAALKQWKKNNDGEGDNDHWRDIMNFKSYRGTLIHYNILNQFAEEDIGGHNEEEAEEELKKGTGYGDWDDYEPAKEWATGAFERLANQRGITQESVLNVECFVQNTDIGFAGQFDLLYIDDDGDVVLSDLKTSARVYDKHKMQLSAYRDAVPLKIDKLEVIRLHPDSETAEVSHDSDWLEDPDELYEEFVELRESMNEDLSRIKKHGVDDG